MTQGVAMATPGAASWLLLIDFTCNCPQTWRKHKLNSILGSQDLRIIEVQYCLTFKGSQLTMHVSFWRSKREPPLPSNFRKMRGEGGGGGSAPPLANRVKMGQSKKFCFRIFMTLAAERLNLHVKKHHHWSVNWGWHIMREKHDKT